MIHKLALQVETADRQLDIDMFERGGVSLDTKVALADGSTVAWGGAELKKAGGEPYVFDLIITLASSVATGVVASWLYDRLKGRATKLRINRTVVEIDAEKIRVVIEQIEESEQ